MEIMSHKRIYTYIESMINITTVFCVLSRGSSQEAYTLFYKYKTVCEKITNIKLPGESIAGRLRVQKAEGGKKG